MKARPVPDNRPSLNEDHRDEKNRTILICGMILLAMVLLSLYAIARDATLLLTSSSSVGAGIFIILRYYFRAE